MCSYSGDTAFDTAMWYRCPPISHAHIKQGLFMASYSN